MGNKQRVNPTLFNGLRNQFAIGQPRHNQRNNWVTITISPWVFMAGLCDINWRDRLYTIDTLPTPKNRDRYQQQRQHQNIKTCGLKVTWTEDGFDINHVASEAKQNQYKKNHK